MAKRQTRKLVAIVLAAGMGTRMKSQLPKVLHPVCGKPMIEHVLDALVPLKPDEIFVVTGHQHELVKKYIGSRATCVLQKERLGTAHAVMMVKRYLKGIKGDVLVMCGDAPLIRTESLTALIMRRQSAKSSGVVLTTELDNPFGYGRIVRNRDQSVRKIVEQKDTNSYEEKIAEINTGTYCFDAEDLVWALGRVGNNNAQKEYYLTDTVEILHHADKRVDAQLASDPTEMIGVNSRRDLAQAEQFLRARILNRFMDAGVSIIDPATTFIDASVTIAPDTRVLPFTILRGDATISEACELGPHLTLTDATVGANARLSHAVVENVEIASEAVIGPFVHITPGQLCSGASLKIAPKRRTKSASRTVGPRKKTRTASRTRKP